MSQEKISYNPGMEISPERQHSVQDAYLKTDPSLSRRERRLEASRIIEQLSADLSPREQESLENRLVNKYIAPDFYYGSIAACIDAVHSTKPNTGEIIAAIKARYPNTPDRALFQLCQQPRVTEMSDWDNFSHTNPELAQEVVGYKDLLIKKHEIFTATIARSASRTSSSTYFKPRHSRVFCDPNRRGTSQITIDGIEQVESPISCQQAINTTLKRSLEHSGCIDSQGELNRTYYHLSLHGKSDKGPNIVVANGMKDGRLPCDPRISRWVTDYISLKLAEYGIMSGSGSPISVTMSQEGEPLCGSYVNVERRWGFGSDEGLGENYQHIQIEIDTFLRKHHHSALANILSELASELANRFPSLEKIREIPMNESDKHRLEGTLYFESCSTIESDKTHSIWMGENFRKALNINAGDIVVVNGAEHTVLMPPKERIRERLVFISTSSRLTPPLIIRKK